ncbi:MAG: shikimate dehydrogenase [Lachnospiraceae bacterium]|nr:shikimate dehydrogenase [Lachnospiraceae bacterium]
MTKFNGKTKLLGLLGSPVEHSISPMMHNTSFEYHNLNYVYLCFDVDNSTLSDTITGLRAINIRGFNLTMPNKSAIIKHLDHISDAAALSGSVNTVVNENNVLYGYNTDGLGYFDSLKDLGFDVKGRTITILGDGNTSRAICAQAALSGVSAIYICCRTPFKDATIDFANAVTEKTSCPVYLKNVEDDKELRSAVTASTLVTNTTSIGMLNKEGQTNSANGKTSLITDVSMFDHKPFVSDIIYNPKETALLKLAKSAGCTTNNGLGMLLYQGAHAFRLWTGKDMPIELVKETCFPDL